MPKTVRMAPRKKIALVAHDVHQLVLIEESFEHLILLTHLLANLDRNGQVVLPLVAQGRAAARAQPIAERLDLAQRLLQVVRGHVGELLQLAVRALQLVCIALDVLLGPQTVGVFLFQGLVGFFQLDILLVELIG